MPNPSCPNPGKKEKNNLNFFSHVFIEVNSPFSTVLIDLFVPSVKFLYPMKTSKHVNFSDLYQEVWKCNIGNKWVNQTNSD